MLKTGVIHVLLYISSGGMNRAHRPPWKKTEGVRNERVETGWKVDLEAKRTLGVRTSPRISDTDQTSYVLEGDGSYESKAIATLMGAPHKP